MKREDFKLMTPEMKDCVKKYMADKGSCSANCISEHCPFVYSNVFSSDNMCGACVMADIDKLFFKANLYVLCTNFLAIYQPLKLKDLEWEDSSK